MTRSQYMQSFKFHFFFLCQHENTFVSSNKNKCVFQHDKNVCDDFENKAHTI